MAIASRKFKRFYSPQELKLLFQISAYGMGKEYSEAQIKVWRQVAYAFIERIGLRLGFPRRTIATSQLLYSRFHLHYPFRDFDFKDVSIACVLVASKVENTVKKIRDIQTAAWQVEDLLKGGDGVGVGPGDEKRMQIMAIERLVLRDLSFHLDVLKPSLVAIGGDNHGVSSGRDIFSWLILQGQTLKAPKAFVRVAHLLSMDVFRTLAPLSYPPHVLSASVLYFASYFYPTHENCLSWQEKPDTPKAPLLFDRDFAWTRQFQTAPEDLLDIAIHLLELLSRMLPPSSLLDPSPMYSPFALTSPSNNSERQREVRKNYRSMGLPHILDSENWLSISQTCNVSFAGPPTRSIDDTTRIKASLRGHLDPVLPSPSNQQTPHDADQSDSARLANEKKAAKKWRHSEEGIEYAFERYRRLNTEGVDIDPVNYQDTLEGTVRYAY